VGGLGLRENLRTGEWRLLDQAQIERMFA